MKTIAITAIVILLALLLVAWFRRPRSRMIAGIGYTVEIVPLQREFYCLTYSEGDDKLEFDAESVGESGDSGCLSIQVPEHVHQAIERSRLSEIEQRIRSAAGTLHYKADFMHLGSMSLPPIDPL